MRYLDMNCPQCGRKAANCAYILIAHPPFTIAGEGAIDWKLSQPIWEMSTPVTDAQGREALRCPEGHQWFSRIEGVDHDCPKRVAFELEENEVDALGVLLSRAAKVLEPQGVVQSEEQSATIKSVARLHQKLSEALKSVETDA